ncbi:hypothetical protein WICPIJ_006062 [Wickerhamomyces pijperi]|uniref:Cation efflux protein transmembrane domain-containing protein n=1 Tax=Wickerhamomyces pijperi TaxID=599730 RepID=A0A9P8Q4R1_WICPI|nr:hypothetical protein WICPIJ_006062 [Wickerhamomyces pijperi]
MTHLPHNNDAFSQFNAVSASTDTPSEIGDENNRGIHYSEQQSSSLTESPQAFTPVGKMRPRTASSIFDSSSIHERNHTDLLSMGLKATNLKHPIITDKLIQYYEKSSRLETVLESRPVKLIGEVTKYDWEKYYIDIDNLPPHVKKDEKLIAFYEEQNELIERYQEIDKILDSGIHRQMIHNYTERYALYGSVNSHENVVSQSSSAATQAANDNERRTAYKKTGAVPANVDLETGNLLGYNKEVELATVSFAIMLNFVCNIVLLLGKAVVAYLTSSISIFASLIDSALDFLSTLIIYFANKMASTKLDSRGYPIGRNRLEPIGVLVFSVIIIMSFLQVGYESFFRLIYETEIADVGLSSTIIMASTIFCKVGCYIYCVTIKSSSVAALAQDALVDVIFNFFSILMPLLGIFFQKPWVDPLGAFGLSIYIVYLWTLTAIEHINHLTGEEAEEMDLKVILYLCKQFSAQIIGVKNLNCYYVGDSINVEVDLILDSESISIKDSHDLAESLQYTLEALPMVDIERAFVHIDYTEDNFRGHIDK